MFENVYMVWDIYDGPRDGIADFDGSPRYFHCVFDEEEDDYSETFEVTPIDEHLFSLAQESWAIYRAWEKKFHGGLADLATHPGHGGQDSRYDELKAKIAERLKALPGPTQKVTAKFQAKDEQPDQPYGCLLDLEVHWERPT